MLQNMKLGVFINEPDCFEFLNSIKLDLSIDALQKLSTVSKITISFGLGMSLLVGSYFKSAIYVYMYEKRKNLTERPINVLLLVQAIVQHLISSLMIIFFEYYHQIRSFLTTVIAFFHSKAVCEVGAGYNVTQDVDTSR